MKRIYFLLLTIIFYMNGLVAQPCPNWITFTTQQQIDDFTMNYPGCTQIPGAVTINDDVPGEITSLSGLSQLTSMERLTIENNSGLTDLNGLNNLNQAFNGLKIIGNSSLSSLTGLEELSSAAGLEISYNNALTDLTGLEDLVTLFGGLTVTYNDNLTSLEGLENAYVDSLGLGITFLNVNNNPSLSICALPNICELLTYGVGGMERNL